ncbi:MAG: hypothetical protein ABSF24_12570 [Candidatus Bathyarchaeia archaeon]|jgi:hypothetical protein
MKRRLAILARLLVIALVILALFLVYSAVSWVYVSSAPTVTTGAELLITVILCLSVSLWAAFVDKEANRWEGVLVFVGLFFGSLLFLYSYVSESFSLDWMMMTQQTPASINSVSIVVDCLLAITIILALAAIAVFILVLRRRARDVQGKPILVEAARLFQET